LNQHVHLALSVPADILRLVVLLQIAIVIGLDLEASLRTLRGFRRDRAGSPLRALRLGRLARFVAVLAACVLFVWDIVHRLGYHHLDPRTPLAQLALIGWLVAYYLVDRRDYQDAEQGLDELLTSIQRGGSSGTTRKHRR
jgi:hypothetical protein